MEVLLIIIAVFLIWQFLAKIRLSSPDRKTAHTSDLNLDNVDAKKRHLKNALFFAKQQHAIQKNKKNQQEKWLNSYAHAKAADLAKLTGIQFENFLESLFREHGYDVQITSTTGDYGADLLLSKNGIRIAVQAKRYVGSVGVQAVQEALSGMAYYKCNAAWVITTGTYTKNAILLAKQSDVKLLKSIDIGKLMKSNINS